MIISRRYRIPALYSANPLSTRLCFIRFMSTHPPPNKDKDKEEGVIGVQSRSPVSPL